MVHKQENDAARFGPELRAEAAAANIEKDGCPPTVSLLESGLIIETKVRPDSRRDTIDTTIRRANDTHPDRRETVPTPWRNHEENHRLLSSDRSCHRRRISAKPARRWQQVLAAVARASGQRRGAGGRPACRVGGRQEHQVEGGDSR